MTITHTPATIIQDLIEAIETTLEAAADERNACAIRTACGEASDNLFFPADALAAANDAWERARCDLNENRNELATALAAARAFVTAH